MKLVRAIWGQERLYEGASSILYHVTNWPERVFRLNELFGSANTDFESSLTNSQQFWFVSTARSLASSYMPKFNSPAQVILELNGEKIGREFKASPIEYWREDHSGLDQSAKVRKGKKGVEAEDRVFLNKPSLYPLSKYLRRIIVSIPLEKDAWQIRGQLNVINSAIEYGEKHGIQVDLLPFQGKKLHPMTKPISYASLIDFLNSIKHVDGPPLFPDDPSKVSMWWKYFPNEGTLLHLLHLGWFPESHLGFGVVKQTSSMKEGKVRWTLIFKIKDFNTREFDFYLKNHIIQVMTKRGLKDRSEEEIENWMIKNFSWFAKEAKNNKENPFTRDDDFDFQSLEKVLPERLQNLIDEAREKA